jgi:hypothetical protein
MTYDEFVKTVGELFPHAYVIIDTYELTIYTGLEVNSFTDEVYPIREVMV